MAWKCPECDYENNDVVLLCPCGYENQEGQTEGAKFTKKTGLFFCVLVSFFIGWITDSFLIMGFSITTPTFALIFYILILLLNIRNKLAISFFSSILFLVIMIFTFMLYGKYNYRSDMFELLYVFGFLPSILVGALFGLFLSHIVNNIKNS